MTMNKAESDHFLTVGAVAGILHKSPGVIKRYEKSGKLQCVKTETGMRLFRRAEILQFARSRQAKDQCEGRSFGKPSRKRMAVVQDLAQAEK